MITPRHRGGMDRPGPSWTPPAGGDAPFPSGGATYFGNALKYHPREYPCDHMEFLSAVALALVLIAGGGATGAAMLSDGDIWDGHSGMMGGGMMGGYGEGYEDCPYHDEGAEDCHAEVGEHTEECEEHYEDCPYHDGGGRGARRGGDCC